MHVRYAIAHSVTHSATAQRTHIAIVQAATERCNAMRTRNNITLDYIRLNKTKGGAGGNVDNPCRPFCGVRP